MSASPTMLIAAPQPEEREQRRRPLRNASRIRERGRWLGGGTPAELQHEHQHDE